MDDILNRFVFDLFGRLHGPFAFRFVLQPLMAGLLALHDGLADARQGKPPHFWTMLTQPSQRMALLREGWGRVTRILVLGVVMDVLYQLIEFKTIHPLQVVVIVIGLAFVPYLLLRGPIDRIATWLASMKHHHTWNASPKHGNR
jgi:hypothetical protein